MANAGGARSSGHGTGAEAGRRKPRRRTILNLGIPFFPVDDGLNQAEDAVATGFDVLQKMVEEIKKGYALAEDYNKQQRQAEQAGEPRPALPWLKVVERGKELQKVAFEAMKKGNEILLDSVQSGMSASMSFAETLANARTDVDEKLPRLAGPVFDSLTIKAAPGQQPDPVTWQVRNRGLARLRIHAIAEPIRYRSKTQAAELPVKAVRFEPEGSNQEISVLTVEIGPIPDNQPAGAYEGSIKAANFELFIGQLSVEVAHVAEARTRSRANHASRGDAVGTRSRQTQGR